MKTGIYCIKNIVTNKVYIGKASSLNTRKNAHKWLLRHNKHVNIYLQRSWNKYGENSFVFKTIELCEKKDLCIREQYWVNFFKANDSNFGYNLAIVTRKTYKHSKETKEKIKIASLGKIKSAKHIQNFKLSRYKPVLQYDKKGNFIKEWLGASYIRDVLGYNQSHITGVCNNIRKSAYGFIWKYKN